MEILGGILASGSMINDKQNREDANIIKTNKRSVKKNNNNVKNIFTFIILNILIFLSNVIRYILRKHS